MVSKLVIPVLAVLLAGIAAAAEYPCPSDPGFCYRDTENDGCFDSGVDEGPINDEIKASFVPLPPTPGSIVCPPSVADLSPSTPSPNENIYLSTAPGSDILFYGARINAVSFLHLASGRDLLLGGLVKGKSNGDVDLAASGDIQLEKGILMGMKADPEIAVTSTAGSVTIDAKAKFKSARLLVSAAGNITLEDKVNAKALVQSEMEFLAGGDLKATNPKLAAIADGDGAKVHLEGSSVTVHGKARIVTKTDSFAGARVEITATSGDVEIDRLVVTSETDVQISGDNVSIGLPDAKGIVRGSRLTQKGPNQSTDISASDTIVLGRMQVTTAGEATVTTSGTTVTVADSTIKGIKGVPTITISGGPGSTCDLTGTVVKKATLVTNCDTAVGP